jgi:hypothetical protein
VELPRQSSVSCSPCFHTDKCNSQGGAQTQDYGDKAINSIQAKFGIDKDGKYNKYEEKGSDMLRGQFEKSSGKNIPDKVRPYIYSRCEGGPDNENSSATRQPSPHGTRKVVRVNMT